MRADLFNNEVTIRDDTGGNGIGQAVARVFGPDDSEGRLRLARLMAASDKLLAACEGAYTVLGDHNHQWPGRSNVEGQNLLSALRDAICEATERDAKEVQDDYCNRKAEGRTP